MTLWTSKRFSGKKPVDFAERTQRDAYCEGGCGRVPLVIDGLCDACDPKTHRVFERQGGHLQVYPVIKAFDEWLVTEYGVECTSAYGNPGSPYFFDKKRVWEGDWERHMREKDWVRMANFLAALKYARSIWPQKNQETPTIVRAKEEKVLRGDVRLHRNGEQYAISTNAENERDFLDGAASALAALDSSASELSRWLPLIVDVAAKMRGYKADVIEKRLIIAGAWLPDDAAMVVSSAKVDAESAVAS